VFSPPGELRAIYEKHHMLPPFESDMVVGAERSILNEPSGKLGVAICKDMDFPLLSREYGNDGVGLLIVSAWDFIVDGWLHSRMAVMRGVESGFSIARSAKDGRLTLSDNRGRVLAEKPSSAAAFATLLGAVPVRHDSTLYARWGDWFSWLATAALIAIVLNVAIRTLAPRLSPKLSSPGTLL
jgi:apolipoprotein N-acyltransferase